MKTYGVSLEVSGPLAMWARPDTGGMPTSQPGPHRSQVKGLLEGIGFLPGGEAWFNPIKTEICRRRGSRGGAVKFQRYTTNYNGPLRKDLNVKSGTAMQVFSTVIADVCYRLYAEIEGRRGTNGRNPRHHLQDLFERRLRQGRCFRTPVLGWREFTCDYWGPFRDEWEVDDRLNIEIPSMLANIWDRPHDGAYSPYFVQDAKIIGGVLTYAE